MGHYLPAERDMEFAMFELLGAAERLEAFPGFDAETVREILFEVAQQVQGLTESFVEADRNPPVYRPQDRTVTMPAGFSQAYSKFMDAQWWNLDLPESLGGPGAPPSLRWAVAELILGANPAAFMYMAGTPMAAVIDMYGTAQQKQLAQLMVQRRWGATMVLTEPDAGSDVGAGRTRAFDNGDGTWNIEGVKRFITSGEHDLTENIIHLVLARPEGARAGTKGLSLFLVPKYHFDWDTGALGQRNGVYATNVEHKMGLKASTTCELTFGAEHPAVGWLLGDVHDGIAQMFTVIEYARMLVGTKSMATASTGYLNALEFSKTRVQGPALSQAADKSAPRVEIIEHADVRRMLMFQKAYSEGLRALVYYAGLAQDVVASGQPFDGLDPDMAARVNDLLLPLVKAGSSERAWESLTLSLQTLGGSGYLSDYPMEQYLRDCKIDSLYEGTTGIQGLDLFFRKIVKDDFKALLWMQSRMEVDAAARELDALKEERELFAEALTEVKELVLAMAAWAFESLEDPQRVNLVGLNTTRLLLALTDVMVGWLLLRSADVALAKSSGEDWYAGKVAVARWFAKQVLPRVAADLRSARLSSLDVMELPPSAW